MPIKRKRPPPALKHGAYPEAALLPGEDPAEFKALHKGLIADFRPNGRMEEEGVLSIARLTSVLGDGARVGTTSAAIGR
jgi:hypothetical protein